jgi:flagellar basal-body rod protein FlgG
MRSLYVAASGMSAQQLRIDSIANNLANVNTTGFKKGRESFQDVFYQELTAGGRGVSSARLEVGGGVRLAGLEKDHRAGIMIETGNPLHVAIAGRGFLEFTTTDGQSVYSRDGNMTMTGDGTLVQASTGLQLAGNFRIPIEAEQVNIAPDGNVTYTVKGEANPVNLGQIFVKTFVNPNGLKSLGGNLYQETAQSGEPQIPREGQVELRAGQLEGSNVDASEELISMILAQRAYELSSKVIQASDETLQVTNNLKR